MFYSSVKSTRPHQFLTAAALLTLVTLSGCAKHSNDSAVTPQGTVNLDAIKVGQPETTFKDAIITFVVDTHKAAEVGGKTQYLSRSSNAKGGQYIVECKDGKCFELQLLFANKPISKDDAQESLKSLLPADAPPQSKVDDRLVKKGKQTEIYEFGDKYTGTIAYKDKDLTEAVAVSAFDMSPSQLDDFITYGISGKPGSKAKEKAPVASEH